MNLIGTFKELSKTVEYLKKIENKDLSKTKIYLGLWLKHKDNGIFVHQSAYTERVCKCFNMDKTHSLSILMVVRHLNPKKICSDLGNLIRKYLVLKYKTSMLLGFDVLGTMHKIKYRFCGKFVSTF